MTAMKKLLLLMILFFCQIAARAQGIEDSWHGAIAVGGQKLRVAMHFEREDGGLRAAMDSPDQGAYGIEADSVTFDGESVGVHFGRLSAVYDARLKGDALEGFLTQGGMPMRLVMARGEAEINRPQTPAPPFPYESRDVEFLSGEVTLAGTLTLPAGAENVAGVVLIAGSGPNDRDETIMNHKPFLVIADFLTRRGIAVLRYDKRGVGGSGGDYRFCTSAELAADAACAMELLRRQPGVDPAKVGLVGHSEGGGVALVMAAGEGVGESLLSPAFVIGLGTPALKGDSLLKLQRRYISRAAGQSEITYQMNEKLVAGIEAVTEGHDYAFVEENLDSLVKELMRRVPMLAAMNPDGGRDADCARFLLDSARPSMRSLLASDPAALLPRIGIPALMIYGEKDLQVPARDNIAALEGVAPENFSVREYPGLNHLFQRCDTGLPTEYGAIEETFSEEVLRDMAEWIPGAAE